MVLDGYDGHTVRKVLTTYEPTSGRQMDVTPISPHSVLHATGSREAVSRKGRSGVWRSLRNGSETEHYPDSPNHPNFPTTVLNAFQIYH
jgi:aldose 1-epimerase